MNPMVVSNKNDSRIPQVHESFRSIFLPYGRTSCMGKQNGRRDSPLTATRANIQWFYSCHREVNSGLQRQQTNLVHSTSLLLPLPSWTKKWVFVIGCLLRHLFAAVSQVWWLGYLWIYRLHIRQHSWDALAVMIQTGNLVFSSKTRAPSVFLDVGEHVPVTVSLHTSELHKRSAKTLTELHNLGKRARSGCYSYLSLTKLQVLMASYICFL